MTGAGADHAHIPTWDEGIDHLLGKLSDRLAEGGLTINDARVIHHLADAYRTEARRRTEYLLGGYPVTIYDTVLGTIAMSHSKFGPKVKLVGEQQCVHFASPREAREAAAALTAAADECDADGSSVDSGSVVQQDDQ